MSVSRETAGLFPRQRRVALLADTPVSRDTMAQVLALCQRMSASLVVLAPADRALATSILEALLPALEQAGIDWDIAPLSGDLFSTARDYLAAHPEVELVACDSRSGLAQVMFGESGAGHILPVPILIPLIIEPVAARQPAERAGEIDWLRPDLNRGY